MKRRCPHCQTTPLRADAETCWYCGKDYDQQRHVRRVAHVQPRPASLRRRRTESSSSATTAAR